MPRRKFGATQKDRIFFACLPDAVTATRIHADAEALKRDKSFAGTLIRPEHLHVTLFHLGDWNGLPTAVVEAAKRAAGQVQLPPFESVFDRAESFRNSTGLYPFVLTGNHDVAAWRPLHDALGAALQHVGLGGATRGDFRPHVTLLRDPKRATVRLAAPIGWCVTEFVLVHSLLGKTTHLHLDRWPLMGDCQFCLDQID